MRKLDVTITGAIGEGKTLLAKIIADAVKQYGGTVIHASDYGERGARIERKIIQEINLHPEDLEPFEVIILGRDAVSSPETLVYRNGNRVSERSLK